MAIQFSIANRNARLDAIEAYAGVSCALEIRTGAPPADCATAGTGSIIATINLPADWMNNAASGSKTKLGTWTVAASGSGTAGHFRVYNSQATKDNTTCFIQGTCGIGTGDLQFDNTAIVAPQTVTVNTFTFTDGNS